MEATLLLLMALRWFVGRQERGMVLSALTAAVFRELIDVVEEFLPVDPAVFKEQFDFDKYDAEVKRWFNTTHGDHGEALGREYVKYGWA